MNESHNLDASMRSTDFNISRSGFKPFNSRKARLRIVCINNNSISIFSKFFNIENISLLNKNSTYVEVDLLLASEEIITYYGEIKDADKYNNIK